MRKRLKKIGVLFFLFFLLFFKDAFILAASTVSTSTSSSATAYSFQRKTWYDGTRYWTAFHNDADNRIEFWYSTDGSSWTENTSARIDVDTNDFSIEADSSNAFIAYTDGYDIEARSAETADWQYRFKYTIDNSGVGETLTDFPLHIDLTSDAPANFWSHVKNDGSDIRVIDEDGLTNLTNQAHLEGWDKSNSKGHIWVKRTIASSGNTEYVWIYYGNANASAGWNKEGTYNSNYIAVWHFDETSGHHYDATNNNNDSTSEILTQQGADIGKVAGADELDGTSDEIDLGSPPNSSLEATGPVTVEAWVNLGSLNKDGTFIGANDQYTLWIMSDNEFRFADNNGNYVDTDSTSWQTGVWYYVVGAFSGISGDTITTSNAKIYVNSAPEATHVSGTWSPTDLTSACIGSFCGSGYFDGILDELRISNVARSAEWIEFAHLSDKGDGGTAGDEEAAPAGTYPSTSFEWSWVITVYDGSSSTYTHSYPAIIRDSNNKIWITARRYVDDTLTTQPGSEGIDTFFDQPMAPDTNNGDVNYFLIGDNDYHSSANNGWSKAVLKFDLSSIPSGSTVNDATLSLWTRPASGWLNDVSVHRILSANASWTECGVTWNYAVTSSTRWAGDSGSDGGADAGCSQPGTDYDADEMMTGSFSGTEGTENQLTDPDAQARTEIEAMIVNNYGMVVLQDTAESGQYTYVDSSDSSSTSERPKLVIDYTYSGFKAIQSTSANDVSTWGTASTLDTSANSNKYGTIIPLSSGNLYAVWIDGTAIEGKKYDGSSWDSSAASIATGVTGLSNNMSAVSDSSGNVHLVYIDSSSNVKYQEYTTSWQTAVTLDSNSGNEYPVIVIDTTNSNDLYAFWVRDDDVFYKKGVSSYASSDWNSSSTTLESSGTNNWLSAGYEDFGTEKIFLELTEGSSSPYSVKWYTTNNAPNTPTIDNYNDGSWTADNTPTLQFDLVDPDTGDIVKYQIQIDDSSDFSSTIVNYTETTGSASPRNDVQYTPSALDDGSYYWRVKAIDDDNEESSWATANSVSVAFRIDTTNPASFSLDSPGGNSYTNSERPTFRWKAASSPDAGSGLSKYVLEIDNGDAGDFSIDNIPTSRTTDYETNKYLIHYENFNDSDNSNNYISISTKSSSEWSSSENEGKLKEGKRTWKVKAVDTLGNTQEESRALFVDKNSPNLENLEVNNTSYAENLATNDTTPTISGKVTDSLAGDKTNNEVASGPKEVEMRIEKKNLLGLYSLHTLGTINLTGTYWSSDDTEITDNSKQTSNKYSTFEYTPSEDLPYGSYKITVTGKDNAGNTRSQSFNLTIGALEEIIEEEEVPEEEEKLEKEEEMVEEKEIVKEVEPKEPVVQKITVAIGETARNIFEQGVKAIESVGKVAKAGITKLAALWKGYSQFRKDMDKKILANLGNFSNNAKDTFNNLAQRTPQVTAERLKVFRDSSEKAIGLVSENATRALKDRQEFLTEKYVPLREKTQTVANDLRIKIAMTTEIWFSREPTRIYEVKVTEVGADYVVITWKTNHYATSKVNYGLTYDYGQDIQSDGKTKDHQLKITGLESGTEYFYEVMSQNKNYVFDARHEFKTLEE